MSSLFQMLGRIRLLDVNSLPGVLSFNVSWLENVSCYCRPSPDVAVVQPLMSITVVSMPRHRHEVAVPHACNWPSLWSFCGQLICSVTNILAITHQGCRCELLLLIELHWLDVSEQIQFRVAATVYRCRHDMAPRYLTEMCMLIGMPARRQGLRSATTSDLVILWVL